MRGYLAIYSLLASLIPSTLGEQYVPEKQQSLSGKITELHYLTSEILQGKHTSPNDIVFLNHTLSISYVTLQYL